MIRVLICDDDNDICKNIEEILVSINLSDQIEIETCNEPSFITSKEYSLKTIDIVFMDIKYGTENGIEVAKNLYNINNKIKFIFVTSFESYAQNIFLENFNPVGFIMKPINREYLIKTFKKAYDQILDQTKEVVISINGELKIIYLDDLIYIESQGHYLFLHYNNKQIKIREKLDNFQKRLPAYFLRIHKSYLVNLNYIVRINKEACTLKENVVLSVSKSMYQSTVSDFLKFKGEKI